MLLSSKITISLSCFKFPSHTRKPPFINPVHSVTFATVSVTIYGAFIPTPKSRHENFFKILNLNEICRLGDIHKIKLLLKGSYDVLLLWWGIVLIFFWKKNRFIAMLKIEKIRFFFPSNSTCSKTLHISLS